MGIEKIFNFQNFLSEVGLNSVQPGQALVQAGQTVVQPGLNSVHSRFTSTDTISLLKVKKEIFKKESIFIVKKKYSNIL